MLKTDPDKLVTPPKVKATSTVGSPIDMTSPIKENPNLFAEGRRRYTRYDFTTDEYREIDPKGSNTFDNNETNNRDTWTSVPTQINTDGTVCAFSSDFNDNPILGVSSPTKGNSRTISKSSPFSSIRRKVSSVFTKECFDEASNSIVPPSIMKTVEGTTSLGSVHKISAADQLSTPTRQRATRKASSGKALSGGTGGCPGYYNPGEINSPPSTPLSKPTTQKPFSRFEGSEKTHNSRRASSTTNEEQSLELEVIDESEQMTPAYACRFPRLEEYSPTSNFGVNPTGDLLEPLPTNIPMTDQSTSNHGHSRLCLPSNTVTGHDLNTFTASPLTAKDNKSSESKVLLVPTETGDSLTKTHKLSKDSPMTHTDGSTSDTVTSLFKGGCRRKSQQSENTLSSKVPSNIPQQSIDPNSTHMVSSEEGYQNVRQTFFFEDFHANDLLAQAKAEAKKDSAKSLEKNSVQVNIKQGESENQTEAMSNDDNQQSKDSITKETPNNSHGKSKTVPDIPEMDEATRKRKEEWERGAEAARHVKHSPEYLASRVSLLYISWEFSFTNQARHLARRTTQVDFHRDCPSFPYRFAP